MSMDAKSAAIAEIEALYGQHDPPKIAEVPALAAKYGEAELLRMVRKKYNVNRPSQPAAAASTVTGLTSPRSSQPAPAPAPAAAAPGAPGAPQASMKPGAARSKRAQRWSVAHTESNQMADAVADADGTTDMFNRTVGGGVAVGGPPSPVSSEKSRQKTQELLNSIVDSDDEEEGEEEDVEEKRQIAARGGRARRWSTEGIKEADEAQAAAAASKAAQVRVDPHLCSSYAPLYTAALPHVHIFFAR